LDSKCVQVAILVYPLLDCVNVNGLKEFGLSFCLGGFGNLPCIAILVVDVRNVSGCDIKSGRNIPNCLSPVQAVEESFTLTICQLTPALWQVPWHPGYQAQHRGWGPLCRRWDHAWLRWRHQWWHTTQVQMAPQLWPMAHRWCQRTGAGSGKFWIKSAGLGDNWVHSGGVSNLIVPGDPGMGDFGCRP